MNSDFYLQFETKPLYGGAITADLPTSCGDLSDVLPVPDNQEVFTEPNLNASLIVEILEMVEVPGIDAISYIFNDLASANESDVTEITQSRLLAPAEYPNIQ